VFVVPRQTFMKFFLVISSLTALVAGQGIYGPPPGPATTAGSSAATSSTPTSIPLPSATSTSNHVVAVGGGNNLFFSPNTLTGVNMNDTVTFVFMPPFNHSVSQSTFSDPCTLANGGFNSGLQLPGNEFTITITNASAPIWVYCEQTAPLKHCGMGMVFAINPPSTGNTFSNFQSAASALGSNEGAQTGSPALSGIDAFASATPSPIPGSTGSSGSSGTTSGAERVVAGVGAIIAGVAAALYTLA